MTIFLPYYFYVNSALDKRIEFIITLSQKQNTSLYNYENLIAPSYISCLLFFRQKDVMSSSLLKQYYIIYTLLISVHTYIHIQIDTKQQRVTFFPSTYQTETLL